MKPNCGNTFLLGFGFCAGGQAVVQVDPISVGA
jgi:hypothetical protein